MRCCEHARQHRTATPWMLHPLRLWRSSCGQSAQPSAVWLCLCAATIPGAATPAESRSATLFLDAAANAAVATWLATAARLPARWLTGSSTSLFARHWRRQHLRQPAQQPATLQLLPLCDLYAAAAAAAVCWLFIEVCIRVSMWSWTSCYRLCCDRSCMSACCARRRLVQYQATKAASALPAALAAGGGTLLVPLEVVCFCNCV